MANNDPSYFLTNFKGDFNTNSDDGSGYGILPAAEQNQTYVAYFNGVGGTGPELINQTGFFIKYLIDKDGNVTKPKSDNISLINLYNNFEQGKIATVLSQTATQNAANLIGDQTITDIGTIQPIIITETGSKIANWVPTMSFNQYPYVPPSDTTPPPNYAFLAKKSSTAIFSGGPSTVTFDTEINDPLGAYSTVTSTYIFPSNTSTYSIYASFQVAIAIGNNDFDQSNNNVYILFERSSDGGSTWSTLPTQEFTPSYNINISQTNLGSINNTNAPGRYQVNIGTDKMIFIYDLSETDTLYNYLQTTPSIFNLNDQVRVRIQSEYSIKIYGGNNSTETYFKMITNYDDALYVTSSYWSGATYPISYGSEDYNKVQYLTASLQFSNVINNNYIQNTPTASLSMSFSPIILPANIQPGDYIRFEYDPTKQSRIYEVGNLNDGRVTLKIFPAVPYGTILNHFVIYRVVKDGNYIILNVPKNYNANLTGFLQPKYITKELKDNLPNIINKLEADGLLNN